ncbi:coiled-coil domain-containing protein 148 isoform X4 [Columba livia]|uniref:coiled-coil domain-containing protein 148 isoform X4 n=1 Tax=Columba livia TaxID=8932 RepID=UPI0031BB58B9
MKMSEPDHGTSFTSRRISGVEHRVVPLRSGLCSQRYKPKPGGYKHLRELAAAEKLVSAKIQLKIKKTEQVSKMNREQMLLKQHRQVWWREHERLRESRQKVEADIKTFLDEESHKHGFFSDMSDLEHKLSKERDTHQANTVAPIWQLKEDLKSRLSEMQCHLPEESPLKSKINPLDMLQQIESVKKQQKEILEFLALESLALERELEEYKPEALARSFEEKNGLVLEVPSALLSLECPCPDLKTLIIDEYRTLAGAFWSRLQEIDEQLQVSYRNMDWTEEDRWVFQTVIHQYPSDLQRRRMLYLDALQRYLPHKSRHELVKKYWAEKQLRWQEQEEKDLQRLEEFRKRMAEQAVRDRERVGYRRALLEKRLLQKRELALRRARAEEESARGRQAHRQQVAVVAKLDPARAVADTVASRARMGIGAEEEFCLQKPLFKLHTYSEQQIVSDPRLRVELALREAGLHGAPYAREILPKIPPPKLPRRDMESTAFKM